MLEQSTSQSLFTAAMFSWIGDRLLENTLSRMGDNEAARRKFIDEQHTRKRHIFDLMDPFATKSMEEAPAKEQASEEDKVKYLEALSDPKGFKSLSDITSAIANLNRTIETLREQE